MLRPIVEAAGYRVVAAEAAAEADLAIAWAGSQPATAAGRTLFLSPQADAPASTGGHEGMDHSTMDHSGMDHSDMDHGDAHQRGDHHEPADDEGEGEEE